MCQYLPVLPVLYIFHSKKDTKNPNYALSNSSSVWRQTLPGLLSLSSSALHRAQQPCGEIIYSQLEVTCTRVKGQSLHHRTSGTFSSTHTPHLGETMEIEQHDAESGVLSKSYATDITSSAAGVGLPFFIWERCLEQ